MERSFQTSMSFRYILTFCVCIFFNVQQKSNENLSLPRKVKCRRAFYYHDKDDGYDCKHTVQFQMPYSKIEKKTFRKRTN